MEEPEFPIESEISARDFITMGCESSKPKPKPNPKKNVPGHDDSSSSSSSENPDFLWKILILGDKGIGKTSLFERYVDKKFNPDGPASYVQQECKTKLLPSQASKIKLELWDPTVPGQGFYRGAHGIILAYDCGNKGSMDKLDSLLREVDKYNPLKDLPKAFIGLKMDVGDVVTDVDIEGYIKKHDAAIGSEWIRKKVSSKTGDGVEELFTELIDKVRVASAED